MTSDDVIVLAQRIAEEEIGGPSPRCTGPLAGRYNAAFNAVVKALAGRAAETERLAARIAEVVEDDGGCWHACSGCQESNEGYVSERDYPYSPFFNCQPGGGCHECGGIGVLWSDGAFLASYGDALELDASAPSCAPGQVERMRDRARAIRNRHLLHMAMSGDAVEHGDNWQEEAAIRAMIEFAAFAADPDRHSEDSDA